LTFVEERIPDKFPRCSAPLYYEGDGAPHLYVYVVEMFSTNVSGVPCLITPGLGVVFSTQRRRVEQRENELYKKWLEPWRP